ncbi:hypothetical protein GO456_06430 [Leclercia adecarboxylata]|nr:hypothetical protein [Leclercia adecarboxylata]
MVSGRVSTRKHNAYPKAAYQAARRSPVLAQGPGDADSSKYGHTGPRPAAQTGNISLPAF